MDFVKKSTKELEIEMQIILNKNLYDKKIINRDMYVFVSNKLNKLLSLEVNKKNIEEVNSFNLIIPLLQK